MLKCKQCGEDVENEYRLRVHEFASGHNIFNLAKKLNKQNADAIQEKDSVSTGQEL